MSAPRPDPFLPLDPQTKASVTALLAAARHAALAVTEAETALPYCSRIALGRDDQGLPLAYLSGLALHTRALLAAPEACLLIGEVEGKGDPLTQPRLSLQARVEFLPSTMTESLLPMWLAQHPKARVYAGLPDFRFARFHPIKGSYNGGFARAFRLTAKDLRP